MTDIDKAVELARESLYRGGADYNECDLNTLARAVLAMAAVVEAAREQADAHERNVWERATNRTEDAIRTLDAEARRGEADHEHQLLPPHQALNERNMP